MKLSKSQLDSFLKRDSSSWYEDLTELFDKYGIDSEVRIAGFLSQTLHESNYFKTLSENLNYSASRLDVVFPKYFRRMGRDSAPYHRQPEKIANVVYANRMSNGGPDTGDGWTFRGGGLLQLTGRQNYTHFANTLGLTAEEAAKYVRTNRGAVESACWFWKENNLNSYSDRRDIVALSRRVNGGTNGLQDRKNIWNKVLRELTLPFATMRLGSKGLEVKKLQNYLRIAADGHFGSNTERAVKNWQKQQGLLADGIVGPKTYAKMGYK